MTRAPRRTLAPVPVVPTPPVVPADSVANTLDLVAPMEEPAPVPAPVSEYISLASEVTTESVSRFLTSDRPLGFEDMALEAQGKPLLAAPTVEPAPALAPIAPPTNEAGISHSLLARTIAEQEAGRAGVARRTAESVHNREITARENARRQAEGSAAQPGDLSYNERG